LCRLAVRGYRLPPSSYLTDSAMKSLFLVVSSHTDFRDVAYIAKEFDIESPDEHEPLLMMNGSGWSNTGLPLARRIIRDVKYAITREEPYREVPLTGTKSTELRVKSNGT